MTKPKLRCAIYTRKSSEEGLEQDFNSLDAQREACEAYITSQVGEGWTLVRQRFDDGGFSGGNMDRPSLRSLLEEIDAGRIDVVVVYKVDRLTRSLSDFARIIEQFDAKKVSFVSVTQSFNTTTSMGRLTLNVLLSFAQFEREVTSERIRDKLAASKKKGLWMGGNPPLGYEAAGRTLKINKKEAKIVQLIFERYIELKSVDVLSRDLAERKIKSKAWTSTRGRQMGGYTFTGGAIRHLLQNPIYLGLIRHKEQTYPGQHKAIVSQDLWDKAQKTFEENRYERKAERVRAKDEWWLTGKIFDAAGRPMTPTFTSRTTGIRYRYYFVKGATLSVATPKGSITRIRMEVVHSIVGAAMTEELKSRGVVSVPVADAVERVVVDKTRIRIDAQLPTKMRRSRGEVENAQKPTTLVRIEVPVRIAKHGQRSEIVTPPELGLAQVDARVIKALQLTWQWRQELENGIYATPELLAEAKGITKRYVNKMLPLGFLTPKDVMEIINRN